MRFIKILQNNLIDFSLLFFGFFFIFFIIWVVKLFGKDVYYIEILYNIYVNYDGLKNSPLVYKIDFILYAIWPSIFFSIATIIIVKKLNQIIYQNNNKKNKFKIFCEKIVLNKYFKKLFFNYKTLFIYSLIFFIFQFKFYEYFEQHTKYEDYPFLYNNPYYIDYKKPKQKKNLILFYFESLEYDVGNLVRNNVSPIDSLKNIKGKNIFNFKHAPATSFSLAGVLSSQCGLPFYAVIAFNLDKIPKEKLFCLSDILAKHNYEQVFYISVDKQFQRFDAFKEIHNYKIHDVNVIKKDFINEEKYWAESAWGEGVYDDVLIEHAKREIIRDHKAGKNFNYTIINTDTHHPFGFSPRCKTEEMNYEIEQAYEAYKCSTGFIKNFFDDLKEQGVLDNTVVVIMGDHLAFGWVIGSNKERHERNIYFKINTDKNFTRKKMNHYDVVATVLDEMGFLPDDQKHFGFGVSLFEDEDKFNYNEHYDLVMDKDILSAFYMRRLLKFSPTPNISFKNEISE